MHIYSILGSITTVISFVIFIGIVRWAWSKRRASAFAEAANAPFALPDEPPQRPRSLRSLPEEGAGRSPGAALRDRRS
jgi:cytochrome c oxidase cbb3-type subunit 4